MSRVLPSSLNSLLTAPLADGVKWPCRVRFSPRVQRPKISVNPLGHVELVLPQKLHFSLLQQQEFLHSMLPWLQKTLDKLLPRSAQQSKAEQLLQEYTGALSAQTLPQNIYLPLLNENWRIEKYAKVGGYVRAKELHQPSSLHPSQVSPPYSLSTGELGLFAHDTENYACCLVLQKWLIKKARPVLAALTQNLANTMQVSIAKVSVKAQRGRWGSCTSAGNISLNCRLLLLKPHLVEHVIMHELCHRTHMNHSTAFKTLLESFSPQSQEKDKELVEAWKNLPQWALLANRRVIN